MQEICTGWSPRTEYRWIDEIGLEMETARQTETIWWMDKIEKNLTEIGIHDGEIALCRIGNRLLMTLKKPKKKCYITRRAEKYVYLHKCKTANRITIAYTVCVGLPSENLTF